MGPGFKYHIVSISAIFFALTVGLVIGSVFVSPQVADRQGRAIGRLQQTLNSDVEETRRDNARYKECVGAISPLALRGRLKGGAVAIIQTGDYPDAATSASEGVAMGDPQGIVHLGLTGSLDRSDDEVRRALVDLHAANPRIPADRDSLLQVIAQALARGDSPADPILRALDREGLVHVTQDDNFALPVKMVVIVAGSRSPESQRAGRVDAPLARALLRQGISVVICEPQSATSSDIPSVLGLKDDLSTIDNVDTDIGQCALVLAFGTPHGMYGVKPTAVRLMPLPAGTP